MVQMSIRYTGEKRCEATHGPSGTVIQTDAPVDNGGKGEAFSPTDLVGTALATCVVTTMAIVAERHGIAFGDATATVTKEMSPAPRKIAQLPVVVKMPKGIQAKDRVLLENAAHTCPVHRSLHPDVQAPISFVYPD